MKRRENIDEFKVPTNYFDEFENHLLNKINEEVLSKNIGFNTPTGYFNKLDIKIKRKNNSKSKEGKLIPVVSKKNFHVCSFNSSYGPISLFCIKRRDSCLYA